MLGGRWLCWIWRITAAVIIGTLLPVFSGICAPFGDTNTAPLGVHRNSHPSCTRVPALHRFGLSGEQRASTVVPVPGSSTCVLVFNVRTPAAVVNCTGGVMCMFSAGT